jgi:hypothetical protein
MPACEGLPLELCAVGLAVGSVLGPAVMRGAVDDGEAADEW